MNTVVQGHRNQVVNDFVYSNLGFSEATPVLHWKHDGQEHSKTLDKISTLQTGLSQLIKTAQVRHQRW